MRTIFLYRRLTLVWLALLLVVTPFAALADNSDLVPQGSSWKYWDQGGLAGTSWENRGFNEANWGEGPAPLGYGDPMATTIGFGPSATSRYISAYFRRSFVAPTNIFGSLIVKLRRDDGAVVYLNGTEILRSNMPAGTVTSNTLATAAVNNADETTYFVSIVSSAALIPGATNLLAVEVHQNAASSSDLGFDLELLGNISPAISLDSPVNGQSIVLPTNVMLQATAADNDGTVTRVDFYQDGVVIGNSIVPPYSFTITNILEGTYAFSAIATDNSTATTSSTTNLVTLIDHGPPRLISTTSVSNQITLQFSKRLLPSTATNLANYTLSGGAIVKSVSLSANSNTVVLAVSPLTLWQPYTLTLGALRDPEGNVLTPNNPVSIQVVDLISQDIGSSTPAGSIVGSPTGLQLLGGGTDIGGSSDQFQFASKDQTGDFNVSVRVLSLTLTDPWAKAGIVARESVTNSASRFVASLATPSVSGAVFESRSGTSTTMSGNFPVNYPYTWLRLQRINNTFTGYAGIDGTNWVLLGSATIALPTTIKVGLAVTSHDTNNLATASFVNYGATTATNIVPSIDFLNEPLGPSSRKTGLVISEIMYKPAPRTDAKNLEFIEIYNTNPYFEDISGYRLSGDIDYTFPSNTVMAGCSFIVVAKAPADVQSVYSISNVFGPYSGSLKTSGTVRLRNIPGAIYLEINYSNDKPWPVGADSSGHSLVLAHPSYGEDFPEAWDISDSIGGTPGRAETYIPRALNSVVINEILAHTDPPDLDYIELYNHGNVAVDLSGAILTDDVTTNKFVVPNGTSLPARGFIAFDETKLGFRLSASGEKIFLKTADASRIVDAIGFDAQEAGVSFGRFPDGGSEFYRLQTRTPGSPNAPIIIDQIAINEIMYSPISGNADDEYVELFNQGTNAVNIGAWKFVSGISYTFPSNTIVQPGAYVVVARNVTNLLAHYPNLTQAITFGNFSGKLSSKGDRIALSKPATLPSTNSTGVVTTNTIHVVVDEVTYKTGGRWPTWADGGGSSMELINPASNHRLAANWRDSDEHAKATWTTIETTGVLDNGAAYRTINNLQVVMLGAGECLMDNVEVLRSSGGNLVEGTFESGLGVWVAQGDHVRTTLETTEGDNSSQSLHIRASSRGDTGGNRIRVALSTTPTAGETMTLRARVRWLHGWPELALRLNGNYLEATGKMNLPLNLGTPGQKNSTAIPNAGPAIYNVMHHPALPAAGQAVVVTASAEDVTGLASLTLNYRIDSLTGTVYTAIAMVDDGTKGDAVAGDGIYSVTLPVQVSGMIDFYVQAVDQASVVTRFPADPSLECLVRFAETDPAASYGSYHLWLSARGVNQWTNQANLSNERVDGTFVYGHSRVVYNVGGKYAGSPYHQSFASPVTANCHYSLDMPPDDMILGTENFNKIHGPGNGAFDDNTIQREQTAYWVARQMHLPWNYRRYVAMFVNGTRRGVYMEDTQTPDSDVINENFADDNDGDLFKLQPWFEFDDVTATGSQSAGFNNNSWCVLNLFTTTGGQKKLARYRWNFLVRAAHGTANNYTNVFNLIDAVNLPQGDLFTQKVGALVDVEQWMRTFAVDHSCGNWDSFGNRNSQNMYGYKTPTGKWELMIWDANIVFGNAGSDGPTGDNLFQYQTADTNMPKIYATPEFRRAYWRAMKEIANNIMVNSASDPLLDAKFASFAANGVSVTSPQTIKTWITSRHAYLLAQVATVDSTYTVTNNGGSDFTVSTNTLVLGGTAPVDIKTLLVNGVAYPTTWNSVTGWQMTIGLQPGVNTLKVNGYDIYNRLISALVIHVTSSGTAAGTSPIRINEWMAANTQTIPDPTDGHFDDWFELYNPSATAVDLSGYTLTDTLTNATQYAIPAGTSIPAGGFLLVWADNDSPVGANGDLHANFKLSQSGELIALFAPDRTLVDMVQFGAQTNDVSEGRFPDGSTNIVRLAKPSPRASNNGTTVDPPPKIGTFSISGTTLTLQWQTVSGRQYLVQSATTLTNPVWTNVGSPLTGTGGNLTVQDQVSKTGQKYYRLVLLP